MQTNEAKDYSVVDAILKSVNYQPSSTIAILREVQKEYRYLPRDVMEYVADQLKVAPSKIYGVATFYENFSLEPKGKHILKCCDGTACHVRKSIPILNALRAKYGLSEKKKTTDDMLLTIETVACLGTCGLAPVVMMDETVHASMTPEKAVAVVEAMYEEEKK